MKAPFVLAAILLASACSPVTSGGERPTGAPTPPAGNITSVTYETGPCFGFCPVYRVTVNSDGTGTFEGRRNTGVTGTQSFTVTPAQYRAFVAHLEPLRPANGASVRLAGEACQSQATDLPSAEVTWTGGRGPQSFYLYYGCDMEQNRSKAERLRAAPDLLPIGEMVRRREGQPGVR